MSAPLTPLEVLLAELASATSALERGDPGEAMPAVEKAIEACEAAQAKGLKLDAAALAWASALCQRGAAIAHSLQQHVTQDTADMATSVRAMGAYRRANGSD